MRYIVSEKNLYAFLINEESDDGAEIVRLSPTLSFRFKKMGLLQGA